MNVLLPFPGVNESSGLQPVRVIDGEPPTSVHVCVPGPVSATVNPNVTAPEAWMLLVAGPVSIVMFGATESTMKCSTSVPGFASAPECGRPSLALSVRT